MIVTFFLRVAQKRLDYEIKSLQLLVFFFILWRKRASIGYREQIWLKIIMSAPVTAANQVLLILNVYFLCKSVIFLGLTYDRHVSGSPACLNVK